MSFHKGIFRFFNALLLIDYLRTPAGHSLMMSVKVGGVGLMNTFRCGVVLVVIWGCVSFQIFDTEISVYNACETAYQCISKGLRADICL